MKKFLVIAVCFMASMSTMSIFAQDGNLSQGQWNHGLAIGAQWIATDLGFGKAESDVINKTNENYSLDDLRVMYGSKAQWVTYYDKLKAHEGETGNVDKLISTIMAEYNKPFIKNRVKSDVEKYNSNHTGNEVGATQEAAATPAANDGSNSTATVVNANDSTAKAAADDKKSEEGHGGHGFLYFLTLLGLAAGALGTFLALQARKESQAIMNDAREDINHLQKQIDKLRAAIKGTPDEENEKHNKKHTAKAETKLANDNLAHAQKIDFNAKNDKEQAKAQPRKDEVKKEEEPKKEEPKKEEPKAAAAFGEPRILFMAKPDEDDNFSRSASAYEPGNSIFELTTMDGKSGSFTVINKSEAQKLALLMPGDTLARACTGNNIQSSAGKSSIVTDRAGRAQLENGKWHIVVKAIVHYV